MHNERRNERAKPQLARANQPFTPMTHKTAKQVETPYQPLKLNDLATPKMNRSHSSSEHQDLHQSMSSDDLPLEQPNNDLEELKNTLMAAVRIIERMEANQQKPTKPRTKTVATQTMKADGPLFEKKKPVKKALEVTEVSFSDNSESSDVSPVTKKREPQRPAPVKRIQTKPVPEAPPVAKKNPSISGGLSSSSGRRSGEADLEQRMRDMSLLLKRLENQLDTLDTPNNV